MSKKINLAIIFGGQSGEHQVSLSSASGVIENLNQNLYNSSYFLITQKGKWIAGEKAEEYLQLSQNFQDNRIKIEQIIETNSTNGLNELIQSEIDLVVPILHGPFGEDGKLQGLLEIIKLPYLFSNVLAQALAMNKFKAKIIAKNENILTANSLTFNYQDKIDIDEIEKVLNFPIVVKPAELGSSVGMSLVKNKSELRIGIDQALKVDRNILLEEFISGREKTTTVIDLVDGVQAVGITEIIAQKADWFDYQSKYEVGGSQHICPAKIPYEVDQQIKLQAVKIFQAIGCRDLARVDFIWDDQNNKIYFLEINTIPGMTSTSLAPEMIIQSGLPLNVFLDKLIKRRLTDK
jgi:D-alanine-D-alanine ligase